MGFAIVGPNTYQVPHLIVNLTRTRFDRQIEKCEVPRGWVLQNGDFRLPL